LDKNKIRKGVRMIIEAIGENPDREGLKNTPERIVRMYEEILSGYSDKPDKYIKVFYKQENYEEIILVRDIALYSLCEHHLLPFFGKAHVAYIPGRNRIVGVSKIVRTVEVFAHRLQIQERLTTQIADTMMKGLKAQGVMVVIEAEHFCMTMRGVKKPGSKMVTSAVRGTFLKDAKTRSEAMSLINS
jgi:GTP cyclohydrolase I